MRTLAHLKQFTLAILFFFAISSLTQATAQSLTYGQAYNIQNGFNDYQGGYLDVNGAGCQDNFLCVSTSIAANRSGNSGTWVILSATGKKEGTPVQAGDLVIIKNLWSGNGGYLGTRGYGRDFGNPGYLCVSTYKSQDGHGSTTWRISGDKDGALQEGAPINLQGQWNNSRAGYLNTLGYAKDYGDVKAAHLVVSTSQKLESGSGNWRFIKK